MRTLRDVEVGRRRVEVAVRRQPQLVALVLLCALRLEEDVPVEREFVLPLRHRRVLRLKDDPLARAPAERRHELAVRVEVRRTREARAARAGGRVDGDVGVTALRDGGAAVGTDRSAPTRLSGKGTRARNREGEANHCLELHVWPPCFYRSSTVYHKTFILGKS